MKHERQAPYIGRDWYATAPSRQAIHVTEARRREVRRGERHQLSRRLIAFLTQKGEPR